MGGIGAGLFLIALGAILRFAVTSELSWIRLDVVGVVLMLVGIASLLLGLIVYRNRRHGTVITQRRIWDEHGDMPPEETEFIEERRTYDEPPA
jgi:hypothetical protein